MNSLGVCHVKKRGFTLVELLLTIALTFIIGTLVFPVGLAYYRNQMLHEATEGILSTLRKAQSLARTGKDDTSFGVMFLPESYVLFEGGSYETRDGAEDEVYHISSIVSVTAPEDILFEELSGLPQVSGTITLSVGNKEEHVVIFPSGYIAR